MSRLRDDEYANVFFAIELSVSAFCISDLLMLLHDRLELLIKIIFEEIFRDFVLAVSVDRSTGESRFRGSIQLVCALVFSEIRVHRCDCEH